MQSQQFDNMFNGLPAKWADLKGNDLQKALWNKDTSVVEKRAEIEAQEVPIPTEIKNQVDKFIADHKKLGTKNRTIRRMVKRKFNITVV